MFNASFLEARRGGESLSLLAQVVRAIVRPAALALLVTQVLGIAERFLTEAFPRLSAWATAHTPSRDLYSTLLDSAAQIAGIFIGLYFTTVSLVASASYKDVPREVRMAVVGERVGNIYLQTLALLCAVALMLQAAQSGRFGWSPGMLNFALVVGLSVTSVFSFVVLGKRAFEFFDPATLSVTLVRDFFAAASSATTKGLHHRNKSFQFHYQKQAERALGDLRAVTRLCVEGDQSASISTVAVCKQSLSLLGSYLHLKAHVPFDSHWFPRTPRHQPWLLTDSSALEMAVRTHSVLMPKEEPDRSWVEAGVLEMSCHALRSLIEKGELASLVEASANANVALSALVEHFEIEEALRYHAEFSMLAGLAARARAAAEADERARWAAVRALMYGPATIATVTAVRSELFDHDVVRELAGRLMEQRGDLVATVAVPLEVREMLSSLADTLRFELAAEGRRITPSWFLEYLIAGAFVQFMSRALVPVVRAVETTYVGQAQGLLKDEKAVEAATVIQVGLEAIHRLRMQLERLGESRERLLIFNRNVAEVEYPEVDRETMRAALGKSERALHQLLAKSARGLALSTASASRPDAFGHAYTVLADASVDAVVASDAERFAEVFPAFVQLAVVSRGRISVELTKYNLQTQVVFLSDPLLDLLDVSGYAAFRGRLGSSRFEDIVRRAWDGVLGKYGQSFAELLMTTIDIRSASPITSPRGMVRTRWQRVFTGQMAAEGWMNSEPGYGEDTLQEPIDDAVRCYLKEGRWGVIGSYFVAAVLLPHEQFQGATPPRSIQRVLSEIRDESQRGRR